ncbi:hypothetical protein [Escherichia coli]|uniref:hypothetical protein n=1 Tax=Escherichia coli TaxID=562 RepID=UPI000B507639|nr:hypothetical protein [Escherichia coli]RIW25228.1 hypothetical protein D3C97_23295 [Escherichia coli]
MSLPNSYYVGIDAPQAALNIIASNETAKFKVSNEADGFDTTNAKPGKRSVALFLTTDLKQP